MLSVAGAVAAVVCVSPALAVLVLALGGDGAATFGAALARDGALTTLGLVAIGGGAAIALGAAAAWIATLCDFPGRAQFEWALALPLAAPSFVLAYAYSGMTWAGGAAIEVRGFWGASFIYAVGLYPYVYLAARAAFLSQSASAIEAARSLGARPGALAWRVGLPLARPALAAGGALACMEIAADYGAAHHFGLTTLSTAIFRAWQSHGALQTALQLAALLLAGAMVLMAIERGARGDRAFAGGAMRWRPPPRYRLAPIQGAAAAGFCAILIVLGAGLPLGWLARLAILHADLAALTAPLLNTLLLASVGAALALALALLIAVALRNGGAVGRAAGLASSLGYAAPGAVIAVGALALFALARDAGLVGGLSAGLALTALAWTYAARFAAAGVQPIDAGLSRLSHGLDASARVLGASPWRRLLRIDLPIAAPSIGAAALILFIEVIKELPATLILRPFNFDTLAVRAYAYASDERLIEAAAPSLAIFIAGLAPMLALSRAMTRARIGAGA